MSAQVLTPQRDATNSRPFVTQLYTVTEVSEILRISPDTVIRYFGDLPGVIDLGSAEDVRRRKRRYRILRIPRSTLEKFLNENRIQ